MQVNAKQHSKPLETKSTPWKHHAGALGRRMQKWEAVLSQWIAKVSQRAFWNPGAGVFLTRGTDSAYCPCPAGQHRWDHAGVFTGSCVNSVHCTWVFKLEIQTVTVLIWILGEFQLESWANFFYLVYSMCMQTSYPEYDWDMSMILKLFIWSSCPLFSNCWTQCTTII